MNRDVFEGKWKQIRGELKSQWGLLTDDDLDQVEGDTEKLAGLLQEKYGYAKDEAELRLRDLARRITEPVSAAAGRNG
jgi:uncharacterized protein YjbJ (UPF0337 family)